MNLKPGSRWSSAISAAEVVVVRPPSEAVTLELGGQAMVVAGTAAPGPTGAAGEGGVTLGKRYFDAEVGLEVLCVKPGAGQLSVNGRPLEVKEPKALPSSD